MKRIAFKHLIGSNIKGIHVSHEDAQVGKFSYNKIYLELEDGIHVFLDLLDPDEAKSFEISQPPTKASLPSISAEVPGLKVVDVIKSDVLSNIGIVLSNGSVLINDIGEFRNNVELVPDPEFLRHGDFTSLAHE